MQQKIQVLEIIGFCISSSSLLVLNKICLSHAPLASTLSLLQFAVTLLWCIVLQMTSITTIELTAVRVRAYVVYVLIFTGAIYTNMRSLALLSVETIIVVRSCCPLLVAAMETVMLGRPIPSWRAVCALLSLLGFAIGYAHAEAANSSPRLSSSPPWGWLLSYYVLICLSDSYGKVVVSRLQWKSMWGPVAYSNGLSIPPMMVTAAFAGELSSLRNGTALAQGSSWHAASLPLALSCVVAVSISFFGWRCRATCSATGYTILGVVNKLLSIIASALLTDRPLTAQGAACLVGCLCTAALYHPAAASQNDAGGTGSAGKAARASKKGT